MMDPQTFQGEAADLSADEYRLLRQALEMIAHGQARAALPILKGLRERAHTIDPGLGALVGSHLAEALVAAGQRSEAVQVLGEDAAAVRDPSYADIRARLLAQAAPLHPEEEFGLQLAAEADRLAGTLEDPQPRLQTMGVLLALLERGGHDEGLELVATSLADYARRLGDSAAETQARLVLARWHAGKGRVDVALEHARQAHAAAQLLGDDRSALRGQAAAERGRLARIQGQLLEAVEALDLALSDLQPADDSVRLERALAAAGLGLEPQRSRAELDVLCHSGDLSVARRAQRARWLARLARGEVQLTEGLPDLPAPDRQALEAQRALRYGDFAAAAASLQQLLQLSPGDSATGLLLAQALRGNGQFLEALQLLDEWIDSATGTGDAWLELRARLQRAPVLGDLGDHEASRQDARRAAELAEQLHLPLHHVAARTQVAQALARLDLPIEAVAELDRAAQHAAAVGAEAAAVRAALLGALLDTAPVRDALSWRPIDAVAAVERVDPPSLGPAVLLVLARRAMVQDGDLAQAQLLLRRAQQLDAALGGALAAPLQALERELAVGGRQ